MHIFASEISITGTHSCRFYPFYKGNQLHIQRHPFHNEISIFVLLPCPLTTFCSDSLEVQALLPWYFKLYLAHSSYYTFSTILHYQGNTLECCSYLPCSVSRHLSTRFQAAFISQSRNDLGTWILHQTKERLILNRNNSF